MAFSSQAIYKNTYRSDIIRLIILCGGLYVFLKMLHLIYLNTDVGEETFFKYCLHPLKLSTTWKNVLSKPWSLFTYGLFDTEFTLLFVNMIWLWIFGSIIEDSYGINRVIPIFLLATIFSAVVFLLIKVYFNLMAFDLYCGTMTGTAAVCGAALSHKPRAVVYEFLKLKLPLYLFAIIFIALQIMLVYKQSQTLILLISALFFGFLHETVFIKFFHKLQSYLGRWRNYFSSNSNFIKGKKL